MQNMDRRSLEKLKQYGIDSVENLTLVEDSKNEGMNRGLAFLGFSSRSDAMDAYKRLWKRDVVFGVHRMQKLLLQILNFIEPDDEIMAQVKIAFLDGLPASWNEDRVKKQLKKFGEIEKVELARNMPSAKSKDFGFVTFDRHDNAVICAESINNAELGDLDNTISKVIPSTSVPAYPRISSKRDFARCDELPPRSRVAVDYGSRAALVRRSYKVHYPTHGSSYSDARGSTYTAPRRAAYVEETYERRFERPPPTPNYREGHAGDYDSISGSKRSYSSLDDAPSRYASPVSVLQKLVWIMEWVAVLPNMQTHTGQVDGKQCGVTPSQDSDTLFLGNICKIWTKGALKEKLKRYGIDSFEDSTLVEDSNNEGMNRGFSFLEFSSHSDAMDAYKRL